MIKAHVVTGLQEDGKCPNLYSGNDPLAAFEAFQNPPQGIVEVRWDRLGDHEHFKRRGVVRVTPAAPAVPPATPEDKPVVPDTGLVPDGDKVPSSAAETESAEAPEPGEDLPPGEDAPASDETKETAEAPRRGRNRRATK